MSAASDSTLFRLLPSVDELLRHEKMRSAVERFGRGATVEAARLVSGELRAQIAAGAISEAQFKVALQHLPAAIEHRLNTGFAYSLRPVVNATGVILHTNLGRAPLSEGALEHVVEVSRGYSNLELELKAGERGKRDVHVSRLFAQLFGNVQREIATIVVNNNAAAVLLALNSLAEGGEVIVSRGELVEIGGSFRIPDIMAKSGAMLREVGTTNRTRIGDYAAAVNEKTKLILRVHRSNFQIVGFTEQPALEELVALGRKHNIPVVEDLGSGELFDLREVGVHGEPTIADSLRAGIDLVTYSGDKLLGGPQAGLISGTPELAGEVRANPLFRALRADKMFYAALEATLLAYLREDYDSIPSLRMMRVSEEDLQQRAQPIIDELRDSSTQLSAEIVATRAVIGGGSAPGATLPSRAIAVKLNGFSPDQLLKQLREWKTPIIARVEGNRVLLDLRTVEPENDVTILVALRAMICATGGDG